MSTQLCAILLKTLTLFRLDVTLCLLLISSVNVLLTHLRSLGSLFYASALLSPLFEMLWCWQILQWDSHLLQIYVLQLFSLSIWILSHLALFLRYGLSFALHVCTISRILFFYNKVTDELEKRLFAFWWQRPHRSMVIYVKGAHSTVVKSTLSQSLQSLVDLCLCHRSFPSATGCPKR